MEKSENNVRWWYMKLESESEPFDSDEPDSLKNESLWSIQLRDTGEKLRPKPHAHIHYGADLAPATSYFSINKRY